MYWDDKESISKAKGKLWVQYWSTRKRMENGKASLFENGSLKALTFLQLAESHIEAGAAFENLGTYMLVLLDSGVATSIPEHTLSSLSCSIKSNRTARSITGPVGSFHAPMSERRLQPLISQCSACHVPSWGKIKDDKFVPPSNSHPACRACPRNSFCLGEVSVDGCGLARAL